MTGFPAFPFWSNRDKAARLFQAERGDWPQIYPMDDGGFRVRAYIIKPNDQYLFIAVLAGFIVLILTVIVTAKDTVTGAVVLAILGMAALVVLLQLAARPLELVIRLDGTVLRDDEQLFSFLGDYDFQPQAHSGAEKEKRENLQQHHSARQEWAKKAHAAQKNGKPPPPEPAPPEDVYAGASELFVIKSGHWIQLAEFADDPQAREAQRLAATLEFLFLEAKKAASRRGPETGADDDE